MSHDLMTNYDACPTSSDLVCTLVRPSAGTHSTIVYDSIPRTFQFQDPYAMDIRMDPDIQLVSFYFYAHAHLSSAYIGIARATIQKNIGNMV